MKRRVGCVVVREKRVISTGYNGTPRGMTNCNEGGCESFGILSSILADPTMQVHVATVHLEPESTSPLASVCTPKRTLFLKLEEIASETHPSYTVTHAHVSRVVSRSRK
jgi:deoxycytidylate deaminase